MNNPHSSECNAFHDRGPHALRVTCKCTEAYKVDIALQRELVEALRSAKDRVLKKERLAIEALITRAEASHG